MTVLYCPIAASVGVGFKPAPTGPSITLKGRIELKEKIERMTGKR